MGWLVLVLLVPAIVVPIVLLFGFAGCSYDPQRVASAPTIVSAIPLDASSVELQWTDSNGVPATYQIERTTGTDPPSAPFAVVSTSPPDQPHRFVDSPPTGGPKFSYRVRTIITSDGETTAFSDRASVETWRRVFTSPLQQGGVNESVAGHCIVQRVSPGSLAHPGNLILLSIRGASDAELTLSRVTISNAAPSGDDFDSAAPPVDLTTSPVTVAAGSSLLLQPVALNVDVDEPLLVAFDVDTAGNARVARGVAHTAYLKAPPPGGTIIEAGTQNRAEFAEQPNELWIVDALDIATKWPPTP